MIKRIFTLTAVAVCLAAAMLVIYNFASVRQAERAARFASCSQECAASVCAEHLTNACGIDASGKNADTRAVFRSLPVRFERGNPVRLLDETNTEKPQQDEQQSRREQGAAETKTEKQHPHERNTQHPQARTTQRPQARHEICRMRPSAHRCLLRSSPQRGSFWESLFDGHGFILIFLPMPCPPAQQPAEPDEPAEPDTPAQNENTENIGKPSEEQNGQSAAAEPQSGADTDGQAEQNTSAEQPAVVDEADEHSAE